MNLNLWFGGLPKNHCGTCGGSAQGYGCPCWKCNGRGWKYKEKPDEARYQTRRRWSIKVDNYLRGEINDAHDAIKIHAKAMPSLIASGVEDWMADLDRLILAVRHLVKARTKYVTIRRLVDLTCERCAKGEERNEKGNHLVSPKVNDSEGAAPIQPPRCLASGLWDELAKIEKENADATERTEDLSAAGPG